VGRLRVAGVRVERTPDRTAVTVNLMHGETVLTARVERPTGGSQSVQAAAEAAVAAVRQVAPPGVRVVLRQAANESHRAGSAVVAHVVVDSPRGEEHLVGSALGRGGPLEDAAAAAIVDAVDRRLDWLVRA
jgi:archaeosine-15-forming tRNA-guanine transglycosylase